MKPKVVGLCRIRNEAAILKDTLDHFGPDCDNIIVYDDCSVDDAVAIAMAHPKVGENGVIEQFEPWQTDRTREEWRHRQILLEAGRVLKPDWFIYFDSDERLEWTVEPDTLFSDPECDAIYFRLFDAYLTEDDGEDFSGDRKWWGPEYRDIVFAFRNQPQMRYEDRDQREVKGYRNPKMGGYCKHFGKAISVAEWESTCNYYVRWFPEPYSSKWKARKGGAIHTTGSDFGRPLYRWEEAKANAVRIGQLQYIRSYE